MRSRPSLSFPWRRRGIGLAGGLIVLTYAAVRFYQVTGDVQGRRPHLVEELAQAGQPLRARTVQAAGGHPSFGQKTGVLKDGQMLAYGGSGHLEASRDLTRRQLRAGHQLQDRAAAGQGQRSCLGTITVAGQRPRNAGRLVRTRLLRHYLPLRCQPPWLPRLLAGIRRAGPGPRQATWSARRFPCLCSG
jgi:hypothetical protein